MTVQEKVDELLYITDGDERQALILAVMCLAATGYDVSAGFVRKSPYEHINHPKPKRPPLDA